MINRVIGKNAGLTNIQAPNNKPLKIILIFVVFKRLPLLLLKLEKIK